MSEVTTTKEPSPVDTAYQEGYDVARSEISTELGELVDLLSRGRMRLERSIHKTDDATLGAMDAPERAIERVANLVAPGGG